MFNTNSQLMRLQPKMESGIVHTLEALLAVAIWALASLAFLLIWDTSVVGVMTYARPISIFQAGAVLLLPVVVSVFPGVIVALLKDRNA